MTYSVLNVVPAFDVQVTFRDPIRYKHQKSLFIAAEGVYTGQVCTLNAISVDSTFPMQAPL